MDVAALLDEVIEELAEDSELYAADAAVTGWPTLRPGVERALSPQLRARLERLGAWHDATHGDWLSVAEVRALVPGGAADAGDGSAAGARESEMADARLSDIAANLRAAREHWEGDVAGRLAPERVAYFAASAYTSERVYLVWPEGAAVDDGAAEPELYAYDANGEARFADLAAYLADYLADDAT